ncbi:hypothetical protein PILCRDRAFT_817519 [Piloderma croceum F 1598]|uniref:TMEM205-like domain-containing protein n=1 Tax=Piloderma croceum (strain F 1598) TaxID=765440 RepID=A0A0C3G4A5_PILCF|nr:hypothetical protein PILCRDRAFT_817519 [Piloderma croceum F 1598]
MAKVELLTLSSLFGLFSPQGVYLLAYAWLFGMSLWVTFFGGVIAYRALPRPMFSALQHQTFPKYFAISIALTSGMLGLWTWSHPDVIIHIFRPHVADVAQAYALAIVLLSQSLNYFVVGPMTSKVMFQRQKREKEEGKSYNEPSASAEMKALNAKFGSLHGISSLANMGAVIALGFHGLWIGNVGLRGY